MDKIIGIDLGTTNSLAAVVLNNHPVVIPNSLGERVTPSVVRILRDGNVVVGRNALRVQTLDPENTITGIKRFMGRRYNEIRDLADVAKFVVVPGDNNIAAIHSYGKIYTPQMISAMILKSLKLSAETYLRTTVSRVVITVPAYFGDVQREATREAAILAGFDPTWVIVNPETGRSGAPQRMRIIEEPEAAAFAFDLHRRKEGRVVVFDLGGGTFDVTVLDIGQGVLQVLAIAGDGFLGGDDFDACIIDWLIDEFFQLHRIDLSTDAQAVQRIRESVEKAKCLLTEANEAAIQIPFLAHSEKRILGLEAVLTRSLFDELCEELFMRLSTICRDTLAKSRLRPQDIDECILVGGATRMTMIPDVVRSVFGCEPNRTVHPDEAVALGAAIQGDQLLRVSKSDQLLVDVATHSIGIESASGRVIPLISKNSSIPKETAEIFSNSTDNQTSVEVHVVEGEGPTAFENRSLGRLVLDGLPPSKRGQLVIKVTCEIDKSGEVIISATEQSTGKSALLTVHPSTGLSTSDLAVIAKDLAGITIHL